MIMSGVDMPLPEVLPHFLRALPIKEDFEEAEPVYQCLLSLITGPKSALLQPHLPEVLRIFAKLENHKELTPTLRAAITTVVQQLIAMPALHGLIAQLPADLQERLQKYLTPTQ